MGFYAKKAKSGGEREEGEKNIVIAVSRVVCYTVCSSMTAGNAGLDVALCVCVPLNGGVGGDPLN